MSERDEFINYLEPDWNGYDENNNDDFEAFAKSDSTDKLRTPDAYLGLNDSQNQNFFSKASRCV